MSAEYINRQLFANKFAMSSLTGIICPSCAHSFVSLGLISAISVIFFLGLNGHLKGLQGLVGIWTAIKKLSLLTWESVPWHNNLVRFAGLTTFRRRETLAPFFNAENCLRVLFIHLLLALHLTSLPLATVSLPPAKTGPGVQRQT